MVNIVSFTLRLETQDAERLGRMAAANDRTMSAEARRAIRFYLNALERRAEQLRHP